jgi:hypothetical protein
MNERQRQLIERLNDMYQSQSSEFKSRYRDNYFELLDFIYNPNTVQITGESIIRYINRTSPRDGICAYDWRNSAEETPNEGEKVEIQIITTDNYYYYEATFKTNVPTGEQAFFWDGGFHKVSNNVRWRRLEESEK